MGITPLDLWARQKTGGLPMDAWQLGKLRETLTHARNSPFYRARLPDVCPQRLSDMHRLPLMDADDLVRHGPRLLCVPPQDIARIVTLDTSGTGGQPKRLYFTAADLELTVDFFARGLPTVVEPERVMAVMMPCRMPYSVGDLICRSLGRIPARGVPWGPLTSFALTGAMLQREGVTSLVGLPAQVLALARYLALTGTKTALRSVLLSADNIPAVVKTELAARGLRVYTHFGMTETGYGCAIDCDCHAGQHIREPDLLLEIIDPITGLPMPDGCRGEIVITTLTRRGMPLIRYRTGDHGRIVPGLCPCTSTLRRLDDVHGRWRDGLAFPRGTLRMPVLDEALFAFGQVVDFSATASSGGLYVKVLTFPGLPPLTGDAVRAALAAIPPLHGVEIATEIALCSDDMPLHRGKRTFGA